MTKSLTTLAPNQRLGWRVVQSVTFAAGLFIVIALLVRPRLGLGALWNVLVPIAPSLLVVAPGLWRNVCPLGSTALWTRHMGLSARRRLSPSAQGWFALGGVVLLLLIVPLRHIVLNTNGPVTGLVLLAVGLASIGIGMTFEWKSGWCSGLCPVHPVEKLYGQRPALSVANAHCTECFRCTAVCADSTPWMSPLVTPGTTGHRTAGTLLVGGFPGYVWGWFQVSDAAGLDARGLATAYAWPFAGLFATLVVYLALRSIVDKRAVDTLGRVFAAAAVSCYYWFRLPMLVGFGRFAGEGVLIDVHGALPSWTPTALRIASTMFFVWWLVFRTSPRRSWAVRPRYAAGHQPGSERDSQGTPASITVSA
ncbi:MAG: ferredoxin [Phycisphaerales bacterium]|nr:ferredoxin [Phycisphaerales bacterium]